MGLFKDIWENRSLIGEGLRNKFFPPETLRELINKTVMERKEICNICPNMSENAKKLKGYKTFRLDEHCTLCGCNIELKVSSLDSSCPDNPSRWESVVSEEDFSHIQQTIKEHEESSSKEHTSESIEGNNKEV